MPCYETSSLSIALPVRRHLTFPNLIKTATALTFKTVAARWDGILTYHSSCHTLRGMHIDRQPRALLANVRGATLVDLPEADSCCGFGGIFSMEHPELSAEWLKRKIGNLEITRSPTLVVTEAGCLMHLAGGLHREKKEQRVIHIAEILNSHQL